jgi:hypothetical protein
MKKRYEFGSKRNTVTGKKPEAMLMVYAFVLHLQGRKFISELTKGLW